MKNVLFVLSVIVLLFAVSCESTSPARLSIVNDAEVPVFWQLQKTADSAIEKFFELEKGAKTSFILESNTEFILSYAALADESVAVEDNVLVINQISGDIKQITFFTVLPKGKIRFTGNVSALECDIVFQPGF